MVRSINHKNHLNKRRFVLTHAKGFYGRKKNCYTLARPVVARALYNKYISRKLLKRTQRRMWISYISRYASLNNSRYSIVIKQIKELGLNRKMAYECIKNNISLLHSA